MAFPHMQELQGRFDKFLACPFPFFPVFVCVCVCVCVSVTVEVDFSEIRDFFIPLHMFAKCKAL